MRVALFVTCLVDLMRPSVGFATLQLLEDAGCSVTVPDGQTCCGQPAYSSGDRAVAQQLAKKVIAEFEGFDYVVAPSGSCADHIRNAYPLLLADEDDWAARAKALSARVFELTDFLCTVLKVDTVAGRFAGSVTYHDSCSGLRGLGIREQPRHLLSKVPGLELREMTAANECCGFGGAFSLKFGDLSAAIAARKCGNVRATQADAIVGGDLGCLLNIEGRLRREGDEQTRVLHVAEVLAGVDGVEHGADAATGGAKGVAGGGAL
ncbi:(Fe-S)-binding protein [Rhodocyclus gracilis]|uniref:(Fe-S)-binding protein n=1 Tax=Rhodocyclus tenuis TaxID=1066 RepID=A0A6L5JU92_RHOTE|nr:(Fe-S)-binding protein [Rhodocyclus gracilis]MQY50621.1 (Fe-S)-binding protein [Rhodocyclus gracilis]